MGWIIWIPLTVNSKFKDQLHSRWFPLYLKLGYQATPRKWKGEGDYHRLGLHTLQYLDVPWVQFGLRSRGDTADPLNCPKEFFNNVNVGLYGLDNNAPSNVHNLPDPQSHLAKVAKTPKNVQAAVFDGVSWPRELRSGALIPSSSSAAAAASQEDDDDGDKETPPPPADHAAATTLADVLHFLDQNESSHSVVLSSILSSQAYQEQSFAFITTANRGRSSQERSLS